MSRTLKLPVGTSEEDKKRLQIQAGSKNMMFSIAADLLKDSIAFFKEYKVLKHDYSQMAATLLAKVTDPTNDLNKKDPEYLALIKRLTDQVSSFCFLMYNAESPEQMMIYSNILESIALGEYQISTDSQRDLVLEKAQLICRLLAHARQHPKDTEWVWPILAEHNIKKDYSYHPLEVIYSLIVRDEIKKSTYIENVTFTATAPNNGKNA